MTKYFENLNGDLLVDPIEKNHTDLVELTSQEFQEKLEIKNKVEVTVQQQIDALEASISARRWREAYLGDEEAKLFIADVNAQIEVLRESL